MVGELAGDAHEGVPMGGAANDLAWLPAWLASLELVPDVPLPGGVTHSDVLALLEFAYEAAADNTNRLSTKVPGDDATITVRHGWQPELPVFTVEWEQSVTGATLDAFLDMNMRTMAETAADWDTTFLSADYLADHGTADNLLQFARLVRWRFRAAPLQDREMLYIVVPYRGKGGGGPLMLNYISVRGPRYPLTAGYARARNLVPSFDLCEVVVGDEGASGGEGAMRIQHCMTTDIGGSVPKLVWNHVFKGAVLAQNHVEAAHVRDALRGTRSPMDHHPTKPPPVGAAAVAAGGGGGGATAIIAPPITPITRQRVVVIGVGDSGLTTIVHMSRRTDLEIVAISPMSCYCSPQELGGRLSQPKVWKDAYLLPFRAYKGLDHVRIVHGLATRLSTDENSRCVGVRLADGTECDEPYDAVLIATGCANGFWRTAPAISTLGDVEATLRMEQGKIHTASTIAIVGGGPSGVSAAYNLAVRHHPSKAVHCFISSEQILPGYHPRTRARIAARMADAGVVVHSHHRAIVPSTESERRQMGSGSIAWSTGQPEFRADVIIWATGGVTPNSTFLPPAMLTSEGLVAVDPYLRVNGFERVFAVGDIADTDPARTSARNDGWALVNANIQAFLDGQPGKMKAYQPPNYRWGSIIGPWDGQGYEVDFATGLRFWVPLTVWNCLWPLVQRFLFGGMRTAVDWTAREY